MIGIYVDPKEKPSQFLQRVTTSQSEGGTEITGRETQEGHTLWRIWVQKNFEKLRLLPANHVLGEVKALQQIQQLPGDNRFLNHPMTASFLSGPGTATSTLGVGLFAMALGGVLAWLVGNSQEETLRRLEETVATLVLEIKNLEVERAKEKISQKEYEKKVQEVVDKNIRNFTAGHK